VLSVARSIVFGRDRVAVGVARARFAATIHQSDPKIAVSRADSAPVERSTAFATAQSTAFERSTIGALAPRSNASRCADRDRNRKTNNDRAGRPH